MDESVIISTVAGGVLIGSAASLLMLFIGRICGIGGIARGLFEEEQGDLWRVAFLVGLVGGSGIARLMSYGPSSLTFQSSLFELMFGGLLIGIGARLASGCTSGHGVCGIARFSIRSIVAIFLFISVGMITVYIRRHFLGG